MKKNMRKFLFGAVAAGLTAVAGVSAAVADFRVYDYEQFVEDGHHFNGTNPNFVQTVVDYQVSQNPQESFTGLSRCGYERIGDNAAFRKEAHIAQWVFFSSAANYFLQASEVDGRRFLIIKDNNGRQFHLFGVRKDGAYVEKVCNALDPQTGFISQCQTMEKPSMPRDYFDNYTTTPVQACEKYIPIWNRERATERAAYGQETDISAMLPAGSSVELKAYMKQAKHNFSVLDAK